MSCNNDDFEIIDHVDCIDAISHSNSLYSPISSPNFSSSSDSSVAINTDEYFRYDVVSFDYEERGDVFADQNYNTFNSNMHNSNMNETKYNTFYNEPEFHSACCNMDYIAHLDHLLMRGIAPIDRYLTKFAKFCDKKFGK